MSSPSRLRIEKGDTAWIVSVKTPKPPTSTRKALETLRPSLCYPSKIKKEKKDNSWIMKHQCLEDAKIDPAKPEILSSPVTYQTFTRCVIEMDENDYDHDTSYEYDSYIANEDDSLGESDLQANAEYKTICKNKNFFCCGNLCVCWYWPHVSEL